MEVKYLPLGMFDSNSYIVGQNGEGVVIDCGAPTRAIIEAASRMQLVIKKIILTHGHIDHIYNVDTLKTETGAEVFMHSSDMACLSDPIKNLSMVFGYSKTFATDVKMLKDGDILSAGGLEYKIIHTPGHTSGGICIAAGNVIFSGDSIFRMAVGRTDFGDGDHDQLLRSVVDMLKRHNDDIIIYPGHEAETTVGYEKKFNPFIRSYFKD